MRLRPDWGKPMINPNRPDDLLDGKLTSEQIQNFREVLVGMIGPYALIMPDEEIQKFMDKLQAKVDSLAV